MGPERESGEEGDQRFQYDYRNRLTVVTDLTGAEVARYAYDTENRRVRKTVGATTTETVWDGWEPIEEYRDGQLASRRLFGPQLGELVRLEQDLDGDGSLEQTYLPVFDVLGNLAELRRENGDLVERYEYSPFGERRVVPAGTNPCEWIDQSAAGNAFGFHGLMEDDETGLLYARNRFFDPVMGRFVTTDPLGYVDGPNGYAYGMNSPGNYSDPMGLAVGDYWDPRSYTDLSLYNSPASGRFWQQSGEFAAGEGKGLALALPRAAVGLFQMATHPIQTFKTLAPLNNPIVAALVAHQMAEGYTNKTAFEQGDAFGETVLFGVATTGFGVTLEGLTTSGRAANAARTAVAGREGAAGLAGSTGGTALSRVASPLSRLKGWWLAGSEQDAAWRALSLKDKLLYEIGQKTLPGRKWKEYSPFTPVQRGRELVQDLGWPRALWPQGTGFRLGVGTTLRTGPTPAIRWLVPRAAAGGGFLGASFNFNRQAERTGSR